MAKLLIFRGETQVQEHELKEQTVRIGRGTQNDVVLEDPGKGVSRHHAEIRFEGGRYTLVDLQSQNGIWVSGSRVPSVVLEPGVTAALGPFRLMMPAPPPVSSIVAAPAIPAESGDRAHPNVIAHGRAVGPRQSEHTGSESAFANTAGDAFAKVDRESA